MLLWISWSLIYITITTICAIYEVTLGGKMIEVTLVPAMYLVVFIMWSYCIWCIWSYYKIMPKIVTNNSPETDTNKDTQTLVKRLHESFREI